MNTMELLGTLGAETLAEVRLRMTAAQFQQYVKEHAAELARPKLTILGWLGLGMMGVGVFVYLRRGR